MHARTPAYARRQAPAPTPGGAQVRALGGVVRYRSGPHRSSRKSWRKSRLRTRCYLLPATVWEALRAAGLSGGGFACGPGVPPVGEGRLNPPCPPYPTGEETVPATCRLRLSVRLVALITFPQSTLAVGVSEAVSERHQPSSSWTGDTWPQVGQGLFSARSLSRPLTLRNAATADATTTVPSFSPMRWAAS